MTTEIELKSLVGSFAENKDIAKDLRVRYILPALARGEDLILDFTGVHGTTQSFIHALVSEPIRQYRDVALDVLHYRHCTPVVQEVIRVVYEYMQESLD